MSIARLALALLVVSLSLESGACGYSTSRLTTLDRGGRTIAVKPISNLTFRRDLSLRLTEQILTEIRARTSFVVTSLDRADFILEGDQGAYEAVAIQRADRTAVQMQFRGAVQMRVRDRRTGGVVKEYRVNAATEYVPARGGETLEGSATDELNRRLAVRIVQGLEVGF